MKGYLLARAGVETVVLEKHEDYFRGDTIHLSTLEVMFELGILDAFLQRPHREARQLEGRGRPYLRRHRMNRSKSAQRS
jgi:2-polyprenyl-6-methoxyphenol hydroxylase-like FAD-dependent oxidoreductase